ncbi:MAG: sulfatase [Planctomycetes bacterium]|nr:sulfatase [Planctomycetota bacterium]
MPGLIIFALLGGCERPPPSGGNPTPGQASKDAPNVLWVVWDTARADYLSLYGHERRTTPKLDEWARDARVFEDCISPGSTTVTAHASMFTGYLAPEHGVSHAQEQLPDGFRTVAEILHDAGYRTYLFSSNNYISADYGFAQGFDLSEHPWSEKYAERAFEIVREKVKGDRSSELTERMSGGPAEALRIRQNIKAAGELAIDGLRGWLAAGDKSRPYFAFINWMEAHRQLVPPRRYRERFMTPEQVERSYRVDRTWNSNWEYTVGLREYRDDDLAVTRATYEAAIAELDDLFAQLLDELKAAGALDNTMVIVTADHGEHLGEHHMLDHQFSVYDVLLRVPLVIHDPKRFPAGREKRPVMVHDLFATILESAGAPMPAGGRFSWSLRTPRDMRARLSQYPAANLSPLNDIKKRRPDWDFAPWNRSLDAFYQGEYKLIFAGDGRHELYRIASDPGEQENLAAKDPQKFAQLSADFERYRKPLERIDLQGGPPKPLSPEALQREIDTGYGGGKEPVEGTTQPASQPASQKK